MVIAESCFAVTLPQAVFSVFLGISLFDVRPVKAFSFSISRDSAAAESISDITEEIAARHRRQRLWKPAHSSVTVMISFLFCLSFAVSRYAPRSIIDSTAFG